MRAITLAGFAVLVSPCLAQQPPRPIADLGMGFKVVATHDLDLGHSCKITRDGSGNPLLLWSADPNGSVPVTKDRSAADRWLTTHAAALGHSGFTPVFAETGSWRGCESWKFAFERGGHRLFDADVTLYFEGSKCVGLMNRMPKVTSIDSSAPAGSGGETIWYARRTGTGEVVKARLTQRADKTHTITEVVDGGRVVHRMLEQLRWAPPTEATMTEYTFPGMNFPDQIWADSKGLIWFSEPSANRVTSFDPNTDQFNSIPTTGWSSPDGLVVDSQDRVWFGLYGSGHGLGVVDIPTGQFTRYAPPYSPANLAIPTPSGRGTIYVTDHANEKISEFDPVTKTWVNVVSLPASSYPVGMHLEAETTDAWTPLYFFQGVGRLQPNGTMTRIAAPSRSGPAFGAANDGKFYFTYWVANKLGEYDIASGTFTEYLWRAGENGGPMFMSPNGHVVVGTRSQGYIAVFDPQTKTFVDYKIPTSFPGLKDGLTVAPDGVIWFTETGRNKIAKLVLP